jgi:hypothetical protein
MVEMGIYEVHFTNRYKTDNGRGLIILKEAGIKIFEHNEK